MADAHRNFAYSTVATAPSPATSGPSLVVAAGEGSRFPTPPFNATVWPVNAQPLVTNAEIVRVTAISTDTLTITRTQEGSSARTIVAGDQIAATISAKTLTDVETDAAAAAATAAAAIPAALLDAKGDLIVATANDTAARLAVGSDGQVLTADTAQTAGVKWAMPSSGGYATVQDEGEALTQRAALNFIGDAVTATDDAANSRTNVTVSSTTVITQVIAEQKRNLWLPTGAIDETFPRGVAATTSASPVTSGRLSLFGGIVLPAGRTVSSVTFWKSTAPSGPTNQWFCIVRRSDHAVLAKTVDDGATAWAGATAKTLALTTPYTPSVNEPVYLAIVVVATTSVGSFVGFTGQAPMTADPMMVATADTGLTNPASLGATTAAFGAPASPSMVYAYVS